MKITLQEQLVNKMADCLQKLPANTKLPSERQIAEEYQLSRNTVRAALLELETTGLIRRIHGKGTFVNKMDLNTDLSSGYKFNQQMEALGKNPATKVLSFEKKEVNTYFAQNLRLALGDEMYKVTRLRLADDQPMMFEKSYLPARYFSGLTQEMLEEQSMYDVFEQKYQEKIDYADEYFWAGVISSNERQFLDVDEGTPCLNLRRQTFDLDGKIIEFTLSIARSDQFSYHVRHNICNGE